MYFIKLHIYFSILHHPSLSFWNYLFMQNDSNNQCYKYDILLTLHIIFVSNDWWYKCHTSINDINNILSHLFCYLCHVVRSHTHTCVVSHVFWLYVDLDIAIDLLTSHADLIVSRRMSVWWRHHRCIISLWSSLTTHTTGQAIPDWPVSSFTCSDVILQSSLPVLLAPLVTITLFTLHIFYT